MSDYENGAHDAIEAIIKMFSNIKSAPIIGAATYMVTVLETNGDKFISLDNVMKILEQHREETTKKLGRTSICHKS